MIWYGWQGRPLVWQRDRYEAIAQVAIALVGLAALLGLSALDLLGDREARRDACRRACEAHGVSAELRGAECWCVWPEAR